MTTFFTTAFFTGLVAFLLILPAPCETGVACNTYLGTVPLTEANAQATGFIVGVACGAIASFVKSRMDGTDMEY